MRSRKVRQTACLLSSDSAGSVLLALADSDVQRQIYCVYGHRAFEDGISIGFNGEWLETVSQGYLLGNGYRMYRPVLRRFLAPDADSPFGEGGLNTYAYCAGDPVNRVDPSGHKFSMTGALKATKLMKRTGRTLRSESSVLSYEERKSQPKSVSYQSLNIEVDDVENQNLDPQNALRSEQMLSVFYEYVSAETMGALGDTMRQHLGPDAKDAFNATKQQILEQSISRIRQGLPPRGSVDFGE
ncbi:RHS repeat-associated core domain-containing protein [Pseudomonas sp. NFX1]|uniref:RHS repeat-associated core domain-containing protein n=1 Tax=Pseudomonas sp. NFX1 TaxID=2201355 RepID=UPI003DA715DB